jgi:uncharacterized protein YjbJ (UPF0337 family)
MQRGFLAEAQHAKRPSYGPSRRRWDPLGRKRNARGIAPHASRGELPEAARRAWHESCSFLSKGGADDGTNAHLQNAHLQGDENMNWDKIEGQWRQFSGRVQSKWGKLTDNDMELINGKKDILLGRLQEHYGYRRDQAEREVDAFLSGL